MGQRNGFDFLIVAHSGTFQVGAEITIDQPRWEILHAGEANILELLEEDGEETKRVSAIDPGQHRGVFDHRQNLSGHFYHDGIGVAVGHQPGQRTPPGHAVAARVVDDDHIGPTGLGHLGRNTGAGATADDGLLGGHLGLQSFQHFLT